ncbi:transposase [Rhodococcus sp. BP22]|uniref:IS110 family transposase n=1 Tax=Rhodococcus sp. BP22 TaxID=2758566 RepID=UPI0016464E85
MSKTNNRTILVWCASSRDSLRRKGLCDSGIGIAKAAHHAAAIDNTGRQLWSFRVCNDQHNIERLLAKARATGDSPTIGWAVDLTSPESALLLAVLIAAGQTVTYVPGREYHATVRRNATRDRLILE